MLSEIDPYTGRYFSHAWIQREVLRLTDDEIDKMDVEMDQEKKDGLGLPVSVTNDVAQQQMMSQVPTQPENETNLKHDADMVKAKDAKAKSVKKEDILVQLKRVI